MTIKQFVLLIILIALLMLNGSSADKKRKYRRRRTTTEPTISSDVLDILGADETVEESLSLVETDKQHEKNLHLVQEDMCQFKHCGAGRVCKVLENNKVECICIEQCDVEIDPRRRVCTNLNETFGSDCEVYQARCFCDTNDTRCKSSDFQHVHIEYYGECKHMPACKEEDRIDFPRRMRDWLFNIMRDLADRQELPTYYLKMQRKAESNHSLRWSNAAIWKWCDLDGYPHDRTVSRHELFPIRAPLMALEQCIAPFLDSCDADKDHNITLIEWGKCLELDEEEMVEQCDHLIETPDGR